MPIDTQDLPEETLALHEELLRQYHDDGNLKALARSLEPLHPEDIDDILDDLKTEEQEEIIKLLPNDVLAEALDEADEEQVENILAWLPDQRLVQVINEMPPDEAVEALESADEERAERILKHVEDEHADSISELRKYPEETAGRIMTTEYLAVNKGLSVSEVLDAARHSADDIETLHHVLVVNEKGRLSGEVRIEDLLKAEPETKIAKLMDRGIIAIHARRDQEVAARMMEKYDISVLPVVEDGGQLAGIITFDDIMEIMEEEASEDMYRLAGIGADDPLSEGVFPRAYKRLPWLTTTLVGGLCLAFIIGHFHLTLEKIVALVSFIPVIAGLGGNVGIQSSTITVRGIATGDINFGDLFWLLRREISVAAVIGIVTAGVLALVARTFLSATDSFSGDMMIFCATLSAAVFCGILVAAFIGTMAPLLCHRFGLDPAYAAGPFVTVTIDVSTQTIYLTIATALLL
ncbi:MAG: magnesium transporter [Planctomycetota bacterium]|jgi:magnesium transporter